VSTITGLLRARRVGRPRPLAVDLSAALNLIGTLGKYLGVAALLPTAVAIGYSEPFWPFVAAGAITSGLGYALERVTGGAGVRIGVREGFLVVAATWLLAAGFASLPYLFAGGDQLGYPLDAYF
jgi:trk system potassium uptake protein